LISPTHGIAARIQRPWLAARFPPPETMFLHRKLVGTFLICAKLRARINVHSLIERFL
jgi:hypothetical protein